MHLDDLLVSLEEAVRLAVAVQQAAVPVYLDQEMTIRPPLLAPDRAGDEQESGLKRRSAGHDSHLLQYGMSQSAERGQDSCAAEELSRTL